MNKTLIFDLDGTLVDTYPAIIQTLRYMHTTRGIIFDDKADISQYMSFGADFLLTQCTKKLGPDIESLKKEFRQTLSKYQFTRNMVYPGIIRLLSKSQSKGFALAVNTNKPHKLALKTLRDSGILHYFKVVQGASTELRSKPHKDHMEVICHQLASHFEDCIFVGDSAVDQRAASICNIPFVYLSHGYGPFDINGDVKLFVERLDNDTIEQILRIR